MENNKEPSEEGYNLFNNLSDKKIWIKSFKITNDNIGTALILISGLGAILQIIELSKIDISYIRFFSVTQLTADGALAFVTVLASFIVYRLYLLTLIVLPVIPDLEEAIKNPDSKYTPQELPYIIFLFITVSGAALSINIELFKNRVLLLIALTSIMLATLFFILKYFLLYREFLKIRGFLHDVKLPINFLLISTIIVTMFGLYNTSNIYLQLYNLPTPDRLMNYSNLDRLLERDYNIKDGYKILYFNDRYTFVEITENENIVIYKTDDVLFNLQNRTDRQE